MRTGYTFTTLNNKIFEAGFTRGEILVMVGLLRFFNIKTGACYPSLEKLSATISTSKRTLIADLKSLEAKKAITKRLNPHGRNMLYSINARYLCINPFDTKKTSSEKKDVHHENIFCDAGETSSNDNTSQKVSSAKTASHECKKCNLAVQGLHPNSTNNTTMNTTYYCSCSEHNSVSSNNVCSLLQVNAIEPSMGETCECSEINSQQISAEKKHSLKECIKVKEDISQAEVPNGKEKASARKKKVVTAKEISAQQPSENNDTSATVKSKATDTPKTRAKTKAKAETAYDPRFEEWYKQYPRKEAKKIASSRFKILLKEGVSIEELTLARDNYNTQVKARHTDEQFILMPSTFLGIHERWKDFLYKTKSAVMSVDDNYEQEDRIRKDVFHGNNTAYRAWIIQGKSEEDPREFYRLWLEKHQNSSHPNEGQTRQKRTNSETDFSEMYF